MPPAKTTTARPALTAPSTDGARAIGLGLSALLGLLMTAIGVVSLGKAQVLLTLTHVLVGPLMLWLTWKARQPTSRGGSRAAWSFLVAIQGVLTVYFLFGAPTFKKLLDASLGVAMFPALLCAVAAVALVVARRDYP